MGSIECPLPLEYFSLSLVPIPYLAASCSPSTVWSIIFATNVPTLLSAAGTRHRAVNCDVGARIVDIGADNGM